MVKRFRPRQNIDYRKNTISIKGIGYPLADYASFLQASFPGLVEHHRIDRDTLDWRTIFTYSERSYFPIYSFMQEKIPNEQEIINTVLAVTGIEIRGEFQNNLSVLAIVGLFHTYGKNWDAKLLLDAHGITRDIYYHCLRSFRAACVAAAQGRATDGQKMIVYAAERSNAEIKKLFKEKICLPIR